MTRRGSAGWRGVVLAATIGLAAMGCGSFNTRKPEPPSDEPVVQFLPTTNPQNVLTNIMAGIQGYASSNYRRSLTSDFRYIPPVTDPQLASELGPFLPWDFAKEDPLWRQVLKDARTPSPVATVITWTWGEASLVSVEGSDNRVYFDDLPYECRFQRGAASKVYSGEVDLYLIEVSGAYSVYRWEDIQDDSGNQTLGWLRAEREVFPSTSSLGVTNP
ncbi:MAG: hypothetical protein U0527_01880 [Candidatus Eisenbacteria bacterium]